MSKALASTLLIFIVPALALSKNADDLRISVSLLNGEHSKDSNSSTATIIINGNKLVYDRSYSGYRARKSTPVHKQFKLDDAETDRVRHLIVREKLLVSRSIQQPTDVPGRYVIVSINIAVGKKRSAIKISGMTHTIEQEELYVNARALIDEIDRIVEAHE